MLCKTLKDADIKKSQLTAASKSQIDEGFDNAKNDENLIFETLIEYINDKKNKVSNCETSQYKTTTTTFGSLPENFTVPVDAREAKMHIKNAEIMLKELENGDVGEIPRVTKEKLSWQDIQKSVVGEVTEDEKRRLFDRIPESSYGSLLWDAANVGNSKELKRLIELNTDYTKDLNWKHSKYNTTPLIQASKKSANCLECVKLLIDNGANVNDVDGNGNTALNIANKTGNQTVVDYLTTVKGINNNQ